MFGVYDILDTVGQGGMGIVYRAQDTSLDRIVALKVLKEDLRGNKQVAARFEREAQAFASLNHPNIVHIYSVGSIGRIPYFAMEYVDGAPLSRVMKRERRLDWKRSVRIVEQVAEALSTAHESHIIHRDIKPSNILLDKKEHAYVTDFGIAKVLTAETQLTVDGSRLGTPQYMSPERCMNREITPSSDLYSLGVMLFQMITGRLPYESESTVDLIKHIVTDPPKRLSEYVANVPEDVERLVAYLLEKKPGDRPDDAGELAALCRRVLEGEPLFPESTAASSLREFRESETPVTSSTTGMSAKRDRLLEAWLGVSPAGRIWLVATPLIALAAFMGAVVGNASNTGFEPAVMRRWDAGIAAWTRPSDPATFRAESAGMHLVSVNLPMHVVRRIASVAGSDFAVELHAGSGRAGGPGSLLLLDPATEAARLDRGSEGTSGDRDGPRFLGAHPEAGGYFYATVPDTVLRGDVRFRDATHGDVVLRVADLDPFSAASVARIVRVMPVGGEREALLVVTEDETGASQELFYISVSSDARADAKRLAGPTGQIGVIHGSASGAVVFATQEEGTQRLERIANPARPVRVSLLERESDTARVVEVNDRYALIATQGESALAFGVWDLRTRSEVELGEAFAGAFISDGGDVLLAAPDRRGDMQLWRVARSAPEDRIQTTFIEGGIQPMVAVSRDGRYALCALPGEAVPELLSVQLDGVESTD